MYKEGVGFSLKVMDFYWQFVYTIDKSIVIKPIVHFGRRSRDVDLNRLIRLSLVGAVAIFYSENNSISKYIAATN